VRVPGDQLLRFSDRRGWAPKAHVGALRHATGGRRREIGMGAWGWEQLSPWRGPASSCRSDRCSASSTAPLEAGLVGRRGPGWSCVGVPPQAGVRRRFAPHQPGHADAGELAREGVPPNVNPAPARARGPRHDQRLPARRRHRGDHRYRARPPGVDDVRHRLTPAPSDANGGSAAGAPAPHARDRTPTPQRASRRLTADRPRRLPLVDSARLASLDPDPSRAAAAPALATRPDWRAKPVSTDRSWMTRGRGLRPWSIGRASSG
jgi:hypothetical protein